MFAITSIAARHSRIRRTLSLIFLTVISAMSLVSANFHLVENALSYTEAQSYCRERFSDLATFNNLDEMNVLTESLLTSGKTWIGLKNEDVWIWHWSGSNLLPDLLNWGPGESHVDVEVCASLDQIGLWSASSCTLQKYFVCQGKSNGRNYILVNESKSWRDARSYCWERSADLVSIHSTEENEAVRQLSAGKVVWIGLFRDPFVWSDGSNSSFRFWGDGQPNYSSNKKCIAADFTDEGRWKNDNCNNKNIFICQTAANTTTTTTTTSLKTIQQDVTEGQLTTNQTTTPVDSSQAATRAFDATSPATEQLNQNTMTIPPPTTSRPETANTVEIVSPLAGTKVDNASTVTTMTEATQSPDTSTLTLPAPETVYVITSPDTTEGVLGPIITELNTVTPGMGTTAPTNPHATISQPAASSKFTDETTDLKIPENSTVTITQLPETTTYSTLEAETSSKSTNSTADFTVHPLSTELNYVSTDDTMPTATQPSEAPAFTTFTSMGSNDSTNTEFVANSINTASTEDTTLTTAQWPESTALNDSTSTTSSLSTNITTDFALYSLTTELQPASRENTNLTGAPPPESTVFNTTFSTTSIKLIDATTKLNNASTMSSAMQPPLTSVNVTTIVVSTVTEQKRTSALSTEAPPSTTAVNQQTLYIDDLILIQKNLSWTEASRYCQEHHIDLVQIISADIQDKVAQTVKSATSPHVWLGLRYSCGFKFWFWTSSAAGCYQNWVPGQGPEGVYECGVSGAIRATGGQQWVGLPETVEQNFICSKCAG